MATSDESAPPSSERELAITRTVDAPRELVWKAFTEAERLVHWWGPQGSATVVHALDFRPGGVFHYSIRSPDGQVIWGTFVYHDIQAPERMVFVNSFSDEAGNIIRAPYSPAWPLEIRNTVTFAEHEGKTTVTLSGGPINATEAERAAYWNAQDSVRQGLTGTFDQLADYLAEEANRM